MAYSSRGVVLYEGPSAINGAPIVAVLTLKSTNTKTGSIPQLWILPQDEEPHKAVKSGADVSVCGGCIHRPDRGGSCYVPTFQGPLAVYRAWVANRYRPVTVGTLRSVLERLAPRAIRLGAWGDPAALPWATVGAPLQSLCQELGIALLGYTHRWMDPRSVPWAAVCMASVDSPGEGAAARALGWRTFRTLLPGEGVESVEQLCPAESDGMTCNACRRCDGLERARTPLSVVIHAHGSASKLSAYRRARRAGGAA